jgi:predicted Fe-S protein YdhL (DUF1289 family)
MTRRPKQWGPLSPQEQRKVLQEIADRTSHRGAMDHELHYESTCRGLRSGSHARDC